MGLPRRASPQERHLAKDERKLVNWLDRACGWIGKLDRCQALDGYRVWCPVVRHDFGGAHRILGCRRRYGSLGQGGSGWRPGDPPRHPAWVLDPSHPSVHPSGWRPVQGWRPGWSAEACKVILFLPGRYPTSTGVLILETVDFAFAIPVPPKLAPTTTAQRLGLLVIKK